MVKSAVRRAVAGQNLKVDSAQEFYQYCATELTRDSPRYKRTFLLIDDIPRERRDRDLQCLRAVPNTTGVHCVGATSYGKIQTRNLSCHCTPCKDRNEDCHETENVDDWKDHELLMQIDSTTTVKTPPSCQEKAKKTQVEQPHISSTTAARTMCPQKSKTKKTQVERPDISGTTAAKTQPGKIQEKEKWPGSCSEDTSFSPGKIQEKADRTGRHP